MDKVNPFTLEKMPPLTFKEKVREKKTNLILWLVFDGRKLNKLVTSSSNVWFSLVERVTFIGLLQYLYYFTRGNISILIFLVVSYFLLIFQIFSVVVYSPFPGRILRKLPFDNFYTSSFVALLSAATLFYLITSVVKVIVLQTAVK